jgi:hypothetical protein
MRPEKAKVSTTPKSASSEAPACAEDAADHDGEQPDDHRRQIEDRLALGQRRVGHRHPPQINARRAGNNNKPSVPGLSAMARTV